METKRCPRVRVAKVKLRVGQQVRISKLKMTFAKGGEKNFSTQIFRITKVIERRPRPVYELEDLNKMPIEGQFYGEEMTPIRISNKPVTRQIKLEKSELDKLFGSISSAGEVKVMTSNLGYSHLV